MQELQEIILSTAVSVLTGLVVLGGAYVNLLLKKGYEKAKAETNKIENDNQREFIDKTIESFNGLISKTVLATQTTLVEGIKKTAEDGKLTKEDAANIKNQVKELVVEQLTDEAKAVLGLQIKDLNEYINTEIEVSLAKIKGQIDSSFKF